MSSTEEWNRFWEIDLFRGLAVVGMVIFHFTFDLNFLGFVTLNLGPGLWFLLAFPIAFTFILLVGISMVISYDRRKDMMSKAEMHRKYLFRGLKILAYGMVITVFTRIFVPSAFVIFGILHFIGVSVILSYLLLLYNIDRRIYLVLAVFVSFIGSVLNSVSFETPWFLWLGLRPENFHTLDYFPLLPWFSVVLVGMFLGKVFYGRTRQFSIRKPSYITTDFFEFLGRNSLVIYLLHQPVIIGLLLLVTGKLMYF